MEVFDGIRTLLAVRRYQDRAEDSWEHNADKVVDALARVAKVVDPRLVLLAGDVRAVALIRESLPKALAPLVRDIDEPPAERGDQVKAIRDQLARGGERVPLGRRRRIEHTGLAHVHVCARGLHMKERGVESGKPLHRGNLPSPSSRAISRNRAG